jgi:hypothetical protein
MVIAAASICCEMKCNIKIRMVLINWETKEMGFPAILLRVLRAGSAASALKRLLPPEGDFFSAESAEN